MSSSNASFNTAMYGLTETVMLIGLVGNVVTFIVFSRKKFRKNSISIYCCSLAISDSFIVYQAIVYFYLLLYNYYIGMYSDALCKIINYVRYGFSSIPGWILIAFSIDKILSLRRLTKGMKRPIIHYIIIFCIVLVNLLIYIEVPIYIKLNSVVYYGITIYTCDPSSLFFSNILNIVFIIEGSALPFVIMFVLSLITIKLLRDSGRHVNMTGTMADKRKRRENKYAITCLTFNVLFIALKLPFVTCFAIGTSNVNNYVVQIASFLFSLYFSSGFFIHFSSNSLFRREFLVLFRIRKQTADTYFTQTNTNNTNHMSIQKNPTA